MRSPLVLIFTLLVLSFVREASGQTLTSAIEAAWERHAELTTLQARKAELEARRRSADAWLPNAPVATLGYRDDRLGRDRGLREYELEVGTPVWLPGEGRATRRVVDAESDRLDAQIVQQRLAVAGEVRDAYWAYRLAERAVDVAKRRLGSARILEGDVGRQVRSGQAARTDALLARAERLEVQRSLQEQETALREARIAFTTLTGIARPPAVAVTPLSERSVVEHPRLVALRASGAVARANIGLARIQDRDSPEVSLFTRLERDDRDTPNATSFGVRVRIPFATEGRNAPRRAAAQSELAQSNAELGMAERQVLAEIERARAGHGDAQSQLRLAVDRRGTLAEHVGLLARARAAGDIGLSELIRARSQLFDAEIDAARAEIAVEQTRSRLAQALGLDP